MISSVKLQRFTRVHHTTTSFWKTSEQVISKLINTPVSTGTVFFDYLTDHQSALILLFTSDRGLCGRYNTNVIREALYLKKKLEEQNCSVTLHFVGTRGFNFCKRRKMNIGKLYTTAKPDFQTAAYIADDLIGEYLRGSFREIWCVYTQKRSSLFEEPVQQLLMPLVPSEKKINSAGTDYLIEGSPEEAAQHAGPLFVRARIYQALIESAVSEHSARLHAMDTATENCDRMIHKYVQLRNRARQAAITTELSEIVTGKEALEQ